MKACDNTNNHTHNKKLYIAAIKHGKETEQQHRIVIHMHMNITTHINNVSNNDDAWQQRRTPLKPEKWKSQNDKNIRI